MADFNQFSSLLEAEEYYDSLKKKDRSMFGAIISAVVGFASAVIGGISAYKNRKTADRQVQLQSDAFEYQKSYDANQTQIRTDDMAKAGLNPILASGNAGTSSVSSVGADGQIQNNLPDMLGNVLTTLMDNKTQRDVSSQRNSTDVVLGNQQAETQKEIAKTQADAAKEIAKNNNETQKVIATMNNEAQSGVRSSQQSLNEANAEMQQWQNAYNQLHGRFNGNPTSIIQFLDAGGMQIADWLGVASDKFGEFKDYVKSQLFKGGKK